MISPSQLTVREGEAGRCAVVLTARPTHAVTVVMEPPSDGKMAVSPESLAFSTTDWSAAQTVTVTVTALQDADAVSEKLRITHEAAFVAGTVTAKEYIYIGSRLLAIEPGGGVAPQLSFDDVRVEITDDEASAAGLTVSPGRPAIAEGYTGSHTEAPNSRPTHAVTLALEVSPASLSFSRSNRRRPQGVSLPAAADGGSAAHFGATRDTVNFGAQSAAIESWGAGTIVALALHLPEGGARARANSRAGTGSRPPATRSIAKGMRSSERLWRIVRKTGKKIRLRTRRAYT